MRLKQAAEEYVRSRVDWARSTRRSNRYTLDRFVRHLGDGFALKALKRHHVEEWIGTYRTAARASVVLGTIRGFTAWCVDTDRLRADPAARIKPPKRPRLAPRELTRHESAQVLLACPDARAAVILSLAFHEGLRRAEIARLEIADVDRTFSNVHVIGKGGHERYVPLSLATQMALDRYLGEFPAASGPLIRSYQFPTRGLHPDTITILVSRIMRDAGVKVRAWDGKSAHAGRHTFAGALLDNGADIRDVSNVLGHASLAPTWRYLARRQQVENVRPFQPDFRAKNPAEAGLVEQ